MAGCYECNHCGKCTHGSVSVEAPAFVCADCGHAAKPGESVNACAACGSTHMEFTMIVSELEN